MTEQTDVLTDGELEAMMGQLNTATPTGARNYALLMLMAQAGLRCAEALAVELGDLRLEEWQGAGRVRVVRLPRRSTKGKRDRIGIPLSSGVAAALDLWLAQRERLGIEGQVVFCTISAGRRRAHYAEGEGELRPGQALDGRYVRALVARLAAEAGIGRRVHPHMLRHTALTALYDRTQDLRLVQTVAGHSTAAMTERYTHVHPARLAAAMGAGAEPDDEGE